jgi:hypothetical protein
MYLGGDRFVDADQAAILDGVVGAFEVVVHPAQDEVGLQLLGPGEDLLQPLEDRDSVAPVADFSVGLPSGDIDGTEPTGVLIAVAAIVPRAAELFQIFTDDDEGLEDTVGAEEARHLRTPRLFDRLWSYYSILVPQSQPDTQNIFRGRLRVVISLADRVGEERRALRAEFMHHGIRILRLHSSQERPGVN